MSEMNLNEWFFCWKGLQCGCLRRLRTRLGVQQSSLLRIHCPQGNRDRSWTSPQPTSRGYCRLPSSKLLCKTSPRSLLHSAEDWWCSHPLQDLPFSPIHHRYIPTPINQIPASHSEYAPTVPTRPNTPNVVLVWILSNLEVVYFVIFVIFPLFTRRVDHLASWPWHHPVGVTKPTFPWDRRYKMFLIPPPFIDRLKAPLCFFASKASGSTPLGEYLTPKPCILPSSIARRMIK